MLVITSADISRRSGLIFLIWICGIGECDLTGAGVSAGGRSNRIKHTGEQLTRKIVPYQKKAFALHGCQTVVSPLRTL